MTQAELNKPDRDQRGSFAAAAGRHDARRWGQRPSLGVVAIAFNEERDLPRFLAHLEGWVDEIVIVDDGSSDRTVEFARAAGPPVRLLEEPRRPGEFFSDQRNKGIAASGSDWLLHMDIDERVTPELSQEILRAIRDPGRDGYRFRRRNYFLHRPMRGGGWQNWNLIHLARRESLRFGGMFHETCLFDAPADKLGQLVHPMLHLNDGDFRERLQKSAVFLDEIARRIETRGRRVRWFDIIGRPAVEFVRKYVLQMGFRDGTPGLIAGLHSASAIFRAHALVWDRQNHIERARIEADLDRQWRAACAGAGPRGPRSE